MGVRANFNVHLDITEYGNSPVFGQSQQWGASFDYAKTLLNGVGAGQADLSYLAERTVATGANDDIDLAGVLSSALGQTITAAKIKALLILNRPASPDDAANTTNLTLGGAANPWIGALGGVSTSKIGAIPPGGILFLAADALAGIGSVVAGTGDILRIANSAGATAKYVIGLLGTSS